MPNLLGSLGLEHVLQTIPSGLFLVDPNRVIVYWNAEAERLTGYAAHEIIGKPCTALEGIECDLTCGLFSDTLPKPIIGARCTIKTRSGAPLVMCKNIDYLRDEHGRIVGGIESFIDLSKQIELEQQLREQTVHLESTVRQRTLELETERTRLITALDAMTDFAYIASADYQVQFMNKAMREAFGPYQNRPCYVALLDRQDPCPHCPMQRVLAGETVKEERFHSANGRTFEIIHTPLITSDGSTQKMAVFRDITERKAAEEKLRHANRELDAFVYTVSHDLKTPLTPILGYADFLREEYADTLDERALNILAEIEGQGRKMLALMEDVLTLARLGRVEPPRNPVDLNRIMQDILDDYHALRQEMNVGIHIDPLPALRIPETLLSSLLSNLIGNALRYGAEPGGSIEVGCISQNSTHHVFVRDHGPGLDDEDKAHIFDLFYRSRVARNRPGTGIGLTTARKIMSLYEGQIRVEDTPGGGCTFWLDFPTCDESI
ncbi:PAS domain-containing sensor histidine kinase [Desulfuromonas sp. AOP6]|uniref:PAS domain-containing sensor histidine kinase n=1 Tax=Desulfuromonas sp. AOP6 TaxID=1566351 RepID=UPI00127C3DB9|nr:PAS domain-containing sensor histidine kinase [Desulfuromonas sp. AOP6]BCA80991.1 hypothetical protein AOP6_2778 [Desulfuromonas sp. AOP6]